MTQSWRRMLKAPPLIARTLKLLDLWCKSRSDFPKSEVCNIWGVFSMSAKDLSYLLVGKTSQGRSSDEWRVDSDPPNNGIGIICSTISSTTCIGPRFVQKYILKLNYFRDFSNIFLNILTALCQVYIIIPINVGPRVKRGTFSIHRLDTVLTHLCTVLPSSAKSRDESY